MGLTWDCVDIDEESIKNKNASIYIDILSKIDM